MIPNRSTANIVAVAGRRVDPRNAEELRFPLSRCSAVADELTRILSQRSVTRLICSAAAGADLLALDVAGRLGVSTHVVLPYDPELFRRTSVTDRPGDWAPIFDRVLRELAGGDRLEVLNEAEGSERAFRAVNQTIVDRALRESSAANDVPAMLPLAVVVWEGRPRGADDMTDDFRTRAITAGFSLTEVLTLLPIGRQV